ncbi:MAG: class I SAM-dependent methyltransferase, partial [Desulfobacteraceae bacterium]|nr:class I SAM-dependent methyltransferase [Desulfobacteraceae bacterium]
MRWKNKARIMRFCSWMPAGDRIYKNIQKVFGRLRAEPMARLPTQAEMYSWLEKEEAGVAGKRFFEVGTGHVPLAPIGFFLCGAATVITVDLHQRIDWGLTRKSLERIAANRDSVAALYGNKEGVAERLAILSRFQHEPAKFFKEANIQYLAPMDATNTGLPNNSIDCHFSITVLEHIPLSTIRDIFQEAKRILKPNGVAVHFIDMSDH